MPAELLPESPGDPTISVAVKYSAFRPNNATETPPLNVTHHPDDPSTSAQHDSDCSDDDTSADFVKIEIPEPPEGVVYPTLAYKDGVKNTAGLHFRSLKMHRKEWRRTIAARLVPDHMRNTCLDVFGGRMRYLILLISMLCMTATRSNELSFNFTVICMTANSSVNSDTPIMMRPDEISYVFSGAGFGAILFVIPVVYALHYFGSRVTFSFVLICSSLATICLSPLARVGPMWMVPARLLQGLALAAVMPLMGKISAEWSPFSEIGSYAFFAFYRSSPASHPCVTQDELQYITQGANSQPKKDRKVPYGAIFTSRSVWAIWIAFLGNSFGFQLIVQFMPTFLNKVLDMPITKTGMSAIIPPTTQLVVKLLAGWSSDKITCVSERLKLQIFNSVAMCGCGLFLLPLGFLTPARSHVALMCFTASISCLGMVACGSMKSATLVARAFTHFVMAIVQLVVCVGMLLVPILVGILAPDNTISEWRMVFFVVFGILLLSNVAFCFLCSAEAEPWAIAASAFRTDELEQLREAEIVEKLVPVDT
ncbi:Major facilitator superfamily [Aphelenchoides avenae]|nr:Major facilitator superfamily [Aphelenchus avenae]